MEAASVVEQRWSQRRSVSLDVEIIEHGDVVAVCYSRDVGLGGVFLETASRALSLGSDCELLFSVGANDSTRQKLRAKIVRMGEGGYGMMFKDFDTNSFRALQEIMRHSSTMISEH